MSITDPTMPSTSLAAGGDGGGVLLLDVTDTRPTTRAAGIPRDIRQLVRDESLTRATTGRALAHSGVLVAAWLATSAVGVVAARWWVWAAVWLVQIVLARGAYSAMHDAAHGTLLRSRLGNRVASLAWSLPLLLNASLWRAWHLEHHRATASDEDPEGSARTDSLVRYLVVPSARSLARFVSLYGQSLATLAEQPPAYARRFGPHLAMRVDALLLLLTTVVLVTGSIVVPWLVIPTWLVPALAYWAIGAPFFDLPEHDRTAIRGSSLDVSRSIAASAPLRVVVRNSNHHAAHHLVPSVTSSQLPRLDEVIGPRGTHRSRSYLRHHGRVLASLLPGRRSA